MYKKKYTNNEVFLENFCLNIWLFYENIYQPFFKDKIFTKLLSFFFKLLKKIFS